MLLFLACSVKKPHYVIGVSQCSEDIWRDKLNDELKMGTYVYNNVELRFASADDSDEKQIDQIHQFLKEGMDLLIVAPNQVAAVSPAIDEVFDKGIPVIVVDRKTNSQKFTAYIGADNYEMGRLMGEYIATQLKGKGRVIEIMGLKGSSPAIDRHNGFVKALSNYPNIALVASLQGNWTEESAIKAVKGYQGDLSNVDFVFGQNDRMAVGARKALSTLSTLRSTKYCGIDGLPGEDNGIACVRDSILEASYIYPTHGDEVLQLAMNILGGKPYEKDNRLMASLVTRDNANVLLLQHEELIRQGHNVDLLHKQSDGYLQELDKQRVITWMAVGIIALLLIAIVLFYIYHLNKISMQRERVVNTLWNMEPQPLPEGRGEDTPAADDQQDGNDPPLSQGEAGGEPVDSSVSLFITRFKEVVEARLDDSDVSVEDLAADMNLSRVQLYRKVKSITDSSPVEILRTARLNRAYQLLLTTDKSVSEVAYAVGFTAPSYFTKCFKDEYGKVPGEVRSS